MPNFFQAPQISIEKFSAMTRPEHPYHRIEETNVSTLPLSWEWLGVQLFFLEERKLFYVEPNNAIYNIYWCTIDCINGTTNEN